jgi:hypothetical protein
LRQVGGFLRGCAICQILEAGWWVSARGVFILSFTWGRLAVVYWCVLRQLLVANWWLSVGSVLCQLLEAGWWLSAEGVQSISYLMQVDGYLQWRDLNSVSYMWEVGGCLRGVCELCQLLEAGWWLFEVGCVYFVSLSRQGVRTP